MSGLYVVRASCERCGGLIRLLGPSWHHADDHVHEAVPELLGPIDIEADVIALGEAIEPIEADSRL